jgi:hypothetical protein
MSWFTEYRHRMCADDTAWRRVAAWFVVDCSCCSFWRGVLLGGMAGAVVGAAIAGITG